MGALPRPDLPPGPRRELNDALHDLHHRAGRPSLRRLAAEAGCSHTTVSHVFSGPRLPTWGILEVLVEAMDGDVHHVRDLWQSATAVPASPLDPVDPAAPGTPLIAGRRAELTAVRRHLEAGTGLLLVTGEAGIGKTTLTSTAAATADSFVATGHCLPLSAQVPLMPVIDILRGLHATDDGRWLAEARAQHPPHLTHPLGQLLPELGDGTGPPTDEFARQRLFTAIATVLAALAEIRPLTLLVEDLHWADPSTLDLLEHVVSRGTRVPIVGTWRILDDAVLAGNQAWYARVRRSPDVATLSLDPLSRDETVEQLTAHGAQQDAAAIYARTRGHPLFTAQLAAQDEGGEWPRMLGDLLDARLGALAGPEWQVVKTLGVADRPLDVSVLGAVTGLGFDSMAVGLRRLADRHLLGAQSRPDDVSLGHPLLAEAVRRRLVPGERRSTHARLAEALAAGSDADPAEVAVHWQQADRPTEEQAWRLRAAAAAASRHDAGQQADHLVRALALWPRDEDPVVDRDRLAVVLAAADALEMAGRTHEACELVDAELPGGPGRGPAQRAELLRRAGRLRGLVRDRASALAAVEEAVALFDGLSPRAAQARALCTLANLLPKHGRMDEVAPVLRRALEVAEQVGDDEVTAEILTDLAWHLGASGELDRALTLVDRARSLCEVCPGPRPMIDLATAHTDLLLIHGRPFEEVLAAARPALDLVDSLRLEVRQGHIVRSNVVEAALAEGLVSRAASLLGPPPAAVTEDNWSSHWTRAEVDIATGEIGRALEHLAAMEVLPLLPRLHRLAIAEATAAGLAWSGAPEAGIAPLEAVLDDLAPLGDVSLASGAFVWAARLRADTRGDFAPLVALRERATSDPFDDSPRADRTALAATWEAELARAPGRDTAELWGRAATEWDGLTRPHAAAYCRWRAAQVALREGRATEAARLLRRAARDAREHVPLSRAIAATAAGRD